MIYYFSGTGNSFQAAKRLNELTGLPLVSITSENISPPHTEENRTWGLVFPVYAWGLPAIVEKFIGSLPRLTRTQAAYVFAVLTCGDDIGRTDTLLRKALASKGVSLNAVFSLQMRNTYVCLPGFDIDKPAVETRKGVAANMRLEEIAHRINRKSPGAPSDVFPGAFPNFKSYILRPLFRKFLTDDGGFQTDADACIRCGKCRKICPLHNIGMSGEELPEWNGHCTLCLRCYHACPTHAIRYGFFTRGKGQVKINL